jgi:hypothetical protein
MTKIKLISILFLIAGINSCKKKDAHLLLYAESSIYLPVTIIMDGESTLRLTEEIPVYPSNCTETNGTVSLFMTEGKHTISWKCDNGLSDVEEINIIGNCYTHQIGN